MSKIHCSIRGFMQLRPTFYASNLPTKQSIYSHSSIDQAHHCKFTFDIIRLNKKRIEIMHFIALG